MRPDAREGVRLGFDALGRGEAARNAWGALAKLHGPVIRRLHALIPADRLPEATPSEVAAPPPPLPPENEPDPMNDALNPWSRLPEPKRFRQVFDAALGNDPLLPSDSFALLVGVWEASEGGLSGIFPAIHQHGGEVGSEDLETHMVYLAGLSNGVWLRQGSRDGNHWVARHVAALAQDVLESGADLTHPSAWNAAFEGYRAQMVRNHPRGPNWADRDPSASQGSDPTRAQVRAIADHAIEGWKNQNENSVAWVQAWLARTA